MKRFNLLKDNYRIEKHDLYSEIRTMLTKYLYELNDNSIRHRIETEIQEILTHNSYSDLQFNVTYGHNEINVNFDNE